MFINPFEESEPGIPLLKEVLDISTYVAPFVQFKNIGENVMGYQAQVPWLEDEDVDYSALDMGYIYNRSGSKFVSPLVRNILGDSEKLTVQEMQSLCIYILTKYVKNWTRLWETMTAEYNPIHNYNMTETRNTQLTENKTRTTDGTITHTGTDTMEYDSAETVTHGKTTDELDKVYAFNAGVGEARPTDEYHTEDGGTTETAKTGSDTNTKDLTDTTDETVTDNKGARESETINRSGNIGVTTTQKMIEEDRKIWLWNYFEHIFADIDRELTIAVYDPCRVYS